MSQRILHVGIGFATGRKNFRRVLNSYIRNWTETELPEDVRVSLSLFVAYDLTYNRTRKYDFTSIRPEISACLDKMFFIGRHEIRAEFGELIEAGIISEKEAQRTFRKGYAAQRNAILFEAVKNGMDYLIFLDDDEYPVAVTRTRANAVWGGQSVIASHLLYLPDADLTNGYHCGYVSPIPKVTYDDLLTEQDFRKFIEAISNDILSWENIRHIMGNGGVTYADTRTLTSDEAFEVDAVQGRKFISGANLGFNLRDPLRISPFFNPVGARGEDTFLSTCLSERKVLRIPCYTFHDGFATYDSLLDGVLPIRLREIRADSDQVVTRFYRACIGWIRYKPLLLYIADPESYPEKINEIRTALDSVLPKLAVRFGRTEFLQIRKELDKYDRNVKKHFREFTSSQQTWAKIMRFLADRKNRVIEPRRASTK